MGEDVMTALQLPWKRMPPIDSARKDVLRGLLYPGHLYRKAPGPFAGDSIQLTRADIEWLLENLGYDEGGIQGPIDWDQEDQRTRMGLDLRGAVLNELDLSDLPLDGAQLQYAQLDNAHLERAKLRGAHLWGASLFHAYLAGVLLYEARAYAATLYRADL
ncbi:MAG TPA: pentapeptide repeat-containing protein, partial [Ktedonobacterales bacterium]